MRHGEGRMIAVVLSIAMLAVFALIAGGVWMIVKRGDRTKGLLMLAVAAVLIGNVAILTWPMPG
jgi:hypothetical protein